MKEEMRFRVRKTGKEFEALVANDNLLEVWIKIQRWYLLAKGRPAPPTREGLKQTSNLREDLYRRRPPERKPLPILL